MYDNIGINKQRRINNIKRSVRIPKITNRNYYLYNYDDDEYELAYKNYYENEYDYDKDEYKDSYVCNDCCDCCDDECVLDDCDCDCHGNEDCDEFCEEYSETMDFIKKTALISAGVLIGATAITVLLSKRR